MIQKPQDTLLFSVAGARGIVGRGLNVEVAARLALAFSSTLESGAVVVGRDTRPSGESLMSAVVGAITATGRECIDLGIATTPTVEVVVEKLGAVGGIIVTASHNPAEWNALKFLDRHGIFITKEAGDRVYSAFTGQQFRFVDARATGPITRYDRGGRDHIDGILSLHALDVERLLRRNFKVVVDCINGAGSVIAPELLKTLGADVVKMNCKTDGDFYRDPEPLAENITDLAERVAKEKADIGFALDPDADRLALVDGEGNALSEEYTLPLVVDGVLEKEKRGPVVVNMSTSALVDWVAARHKTGVIRTPVGEAYVVARMLEEKAPIGGEGNGGVIYPELHSGRDGLLGMALIMQLLVDRDISLRNLVREYPEFKMKKRKVPLGGEFDAARISSLISKRGADKIDSTDGVKAIFEDGWCHIRVSNTEGIVRVIVESMSTERTRDLQALAVEAVTESWG
ncbi:MAG: phosphoglucosamine mutase [bacterium]|nr:phosphoglucosamine mutase [bacterium]